jgi:hypothetical protein
VEGAAEVDGAYGGSAFRERFAGACRATIKVRKSVNQDEKLGALAA